MTTVEPVCARCGYPQREHSYNGACYGLCGKFEAKAMIEGMIAISTKEYNDLKAEVERLTTQRNDAQNLTCHMAAEIERLKTEIADLKDQIATCRELRAYDRKEIEFLRAKL